MDRISEQQKIASWITKEILGSLTEEEAKQLSAWLSADEKHTMLYQKIKSQNHQLAVQTYEHIDTDKGLKKYRRRYSASIRFSPAFWFSAAAVVILLFGIGSLLFHFSHPEPLVAGLQPGSPKALLILDDGSFHELTHHRQEEIISSQGITVQNNGKAIQYVQQPGTLANGSVQESYNTLKIPTGGEYLLILSDGTKVWLNSQTVLRYPVSFHGEERHVELEGEAYFEVAKDEKRPFYVKTSHQVRVEVLGTSFNVRAYRDEPDIETVLEEGSVRMWQDTQCVTLSPGNRALFNTEHRRFTIESVNTELHTAWHSGQYIFEEETIENILHKLSRWYDMNVFFADNAAKNLVFSGNIRKYDTILHLLNAIEATGGVRFEIKNNTVIVNSVSK